MSAPIQEPETVVIAIRRLIAESRSVPPEPLVLSPALRVDEPPEAPAAANPLVLVNAVPVADSSAPTGLVPAVPPSEPGAGDAPQASAAPESLRSPDPSAATEPAAGHDEIEFRIAAPRVAAPTDAEQADLTSDPGALEAPREDGERLLAAPGPTPSATWPDDAKLHALVAQALREELQGELGERLTRNLRKLVRREVMQALATRGDG